MAPLPLGRTQSIVAVDRRSGEMGAAVLSQSFAIGSRAVWSEPGVGVVVAQGMVEPSYGPLGLALLEGGKRPPQVLKSLLATDPHPNLRQVMIIDPRGRTAAHTGNGCLPEAGFVAGRGFCVQAGFVNSKRVWRATAAGFRRERGPLARRLVAALEAGEQAAGGGKRGGPTRSASVLVVAGFPKGTPWDAKLLDLRVESSTTPLKELKQALEVSEAYERAEGARELVLKGDLQRGRKEFARAVSLAPDSSDLKLWLAIGMIRLGETKEGVRMLRSALGRGQDVKAVLRELTARGVVRPPAEKS